MDAVLTFLRHSHAEPARPEIRDQDRAITREGIALAERQRQRFSRNYDLVLSSTALRCIQTAKYVTGHQKPVIEASMLHLPMGNDGQALDEMYRRLGNAPVEAYHDADRNGMLGRYVAQAAGFIRTFIDERPPATDALIVGHGVLIPAIATAFSDDTRIGRITLDYCTGLTIFPNGTVVIMDTAPPPPQ